ncbi:MAG: hydrogenase [Longimicrobiales bacterium]
MDIKSPDRVLIRAGFLLFTLALLTGFVIPSLLNPRMGLAAHQTGVMNALVLMALGLAWGLLAFSPLQAKLTRVAFLYATFVNWGSSILAGAWGTSRLTPLAAPGYGAAPWQESVVQALQVSLALAIVAGAVSVIYALRPQTAAS